jgi:hypothetical protein
MNRHRFEPRDRVSKLKLPDWLVSIFFDPEFDAQMRAHDDRKDLHRLGRMRFRHVARPASTEHDRKPRFRLRRPLLGR